MSSGRLFVCATPIGNLADMSPRAIQVLKDADLIAAEDTRHTRKLLNHFDIDTPATSYHHFNRVEKARQLVEQMLGGQTIALVTDAGTPAISDPGEELVRLAHEAGIPVEGVPGPSAAALALSVSGLVSGRFVFEGFLPQTGKEKKAILAEIAQENKTMIFYEAPHRLKKTLAQLIETLGDRPACLCHELTKQHESIERATLKQLAARFDEEDPRGEYVLLVEGKDAAEAAREEAARWEAVPLAEHMAHYLEQGMDKKEAMKAVAADRHISKRDVYQALLESEDDI